MGDQSEYEMPGFLKEFLNGLSTAQNAELHAWAVKVDVDHDTKYAIDMICDELKKD